MAGFTKGPWAKQFNGVPKLIYGPNGERICRLLDEPKEANGDLIAASTDLYEALKYARRFLNPTDHDTAYIDEILAKARGEAV